MNKKRVICIVCALVLLISSITSVLLLKDHFSIENHSLIKNEPINKNNSITFNDDVLIEGNSKDIQNSFISLFNNGNTYTLSFKNGYPDFFKKMKENDIFCIYPDKDSNVSFFSLGFCGKFVSKSQKKDVYNVTFTIPKLTDVCSDLYFSTKSNNANQNGNSVKSISFYPNSGVSTEINKLQINTNSLSAKMIDSISVGNTTANFSCKKTEIQSKLKDYNLLCEELKLSLKTKTSDGFSVKGSITLEQPAVKAVLDYHYDKEKDKLDVKEYSLGFIAKQKLDLDLSGEISAGLSDIISSDHIIDIEDVTDSENGKVILGTYLIGYEASLPILNNEVNNVSYLSMGIAVQLTMTASGKLGLSYNVQESGFLQCETNSNGKNKCLNKSYDYPNPVTDTKKPDKDEKNSKPGITTKLSGEATFNMAFGTDIGICFLGIIPIKNAMNFIEFDIQRSFSYDSDSDEDQKTIFSNLCLLDDNVKKLIVSSNYYCKVNLGLKINLGALKYKAGKVGGSYLIDKDVLFQYPLPQGFTHSQCGFGNIFIGEKYTDDELSETFHNFEKEIDEHSIFTSFKDFTLGNAADAVLNKFGADIEDLYDYIKGDINSCRIDYFTSGACYVRDENNTVVLEVIFGENVRNHIGFHNKLSMEKTEEIYSLPDNSTTASIKFGFFTKLLFGLDDIENMDLAENIYYSSDSDDKMKLLFVDDELNLIIIYR